MSAIISLDTGKRVRSSLTKNGRISKKGKSAAVTAPTKSSTNVTKGMDLNTTSVSR